MLPTVADTDLHVHQGRVAGKVVIITGAASGIGRQVALDFAKYNAKIVIGEVNFVAAENLCDLINNGGGQAVARKCDVSNWDDQLGLFQFAFATYGSVDIVVANAGILERTGQWNTAELDNDGLPTKPNLKALDVNLAGTVYTARLAMHYLQLGQKKEDELKALVLLGSLASWGYLPDQPLYTASKHAVLGLMRTLHPVVAPMGIRIGTVTPFFVRTSLLPADLLQSLEGFRLVPVERVAGAIFYAATDPNEDSNGCAWLLDDDGPVVQIFKEEFKVGLYQRMDERRQKRLDLEEQERANEAVEVN